MNTPIRIFLADDHLFVIESLKTCFQNFSDIEVVGTEFDAQKVVDEVKNTNPDIVLLDLEFNVNQSSSFGKETKGTVIAKQLIAECPHVKILILSSHNIPYTALELFQQGIKGYILKGNGIEYIYNSIVNIHQNKTVIDAPVLAAQKEVSHIKLTLTDESNLRCLMESLSNTKIAEKRYITEATVKGELQDLFSKIGAKNRTAAALWGYKNLGK